MNIAKLRKRVNRCRNYNAKRKHQDGEMGWENGMKNASKLGEFPSGSSSSISLIKRLLTRINPYCYRYSTRGTAAQLGCRDVLSTSNARYECSRFRFREQCNCYPWGTFAHNLQRRRSESFEFFSSQNAAISRFQKHWSYLRNF